MRVAELFEFDRPLRTVARPIPYPGEGQVRVRVQACGVCGSDIFLQKGGFSKPLPIVPGHEASGIVDLVGTGVEGLTVGDQVALYYIDAPADSRYARLGRRNIGPGVRRMGVDVDGAFAEYVVRPADTLVRPPQPIDPVVLAVLTDAVGTPYHALAKIARVQPGETVVVLGIGGIGSNAVQVGKHLGAHVVAVSRSQDKLDLARSLGADEMVVSDDRVVERIGAVTGPDGPEVVIQCVESAQMDEVALAVAGFLGRVVFVGTSKDEFRARASAFVWRELTVMGSRGFTAEDIGEVINLYLAGALRVDHMTDRTRPLEEVNAALDDLREGRVLRSVLLP